MRELRKRGKSPEIKKKRIEHESGLRSYLVNETQNLFAESREKDVTSSRGRSGISAFSLRKKREGRRA